MVINAKEFGGLLEAVRNIDQRLERHYEKLSSIDERLRELNSSVATQKEKISQLEDPKNIKNFWQGGIAIIVGLGAGIYEFLRRTQGG